jgi:hypothetical protein
MFSFLCYQILVSVSVVNNNLNMYHCLVPESLVLYLGLTMSCDCTYILQFLVPVSVFHNFLCLYFAISRAYA